MNTELIDMLCLVLPTGDTIWLEADQEELTKTIDKWKSENPEFEGTDCTMGVVSIKMPQVHRYWGSSSWVI